MSAVRLPVVVLLSASVAVMVGCDDETSPANDVIDGDIADLEPDETTDPSDDAAEDAPLTETALFFDDDELDVANSPWEDVEGGQIGVCFTPPEYPATVSRALFYVDSRSIPETEFKVRVYAANGVVHCRPGTDLLTEDVRASATSGDEWVVVDLSSQGIVIEEGNFFVAMEWLTAAGNGGANAQLLGVDTDDPDRRTWWRFASAGGWSRTEDIGGTGDRDAMIRAMVLH